MQKTSVEPIAITGMACRFPGGVQSPDDFWELLVNGTDAIVDVPADRWNLERYYHPDPAQPGKMYVRQGGFLQQPLGAFDAAFFNITPREAEQLDPQQRLLLEVTHEAFEDAGLIPKNLKRSRTGVYLGAFTMDNMGQKLSYFSRDHIMSHTGMSTTMVMLSNRLSYIFDLLGPSMTVDTACSSSMVALHLACNALHSGDCDVALAGGVNVMFRPEFVIAMCKGRFLSPEQRSKAFDVSADGYVRGEGAGMLVLKPLSKAHADGDRIHAVIRATGVNQDGLTEGITLPNGDAQVGLIREVWARAGISADDIDYIEAHGTGTQAGDITEARSIGAVLRETQAPVAVGSVKTNIGHLEAAAGVAGVMKAVLTIKNRAVPPHLHLTEVNPELDLPALHIRIPQTLEPLDTSDTLRVAVNSFGYGGTNAHAVIESAPETRLSPVESSDSPAVYVYSARSVDSLDALIQAQAAYLTDDTPLADYGYTLSQRRAHHDHRQPRPDLQRSLRRRSHRPR